MFSLRDLRFVLCSRDLDVLRAQRIIGFFYLQSDHYGIIKRTTSGNVSGMECRMEREIKYGQLIR